jgi:hypothetical protein
VKLNYQRRPTGLCHACRRSTALPVHQGCGDKLKRSKRRAKKAISDRGVSAILKAVGE